jgi:hypothetical protein
MNAAPVDPIFAAIAQHSVARDALIEAIPRADKVTARLEGREVTKADEDAMEALNLDEEAAFLELFVIVPTTLEGRRALLQHLVQRDEDGSSEPIGEIAAKMLRLPMFAASSEDGAFERTAVVANRRPVPGAAFGPPILFVKSKLFLRRRDPPVWNKAAFVVFDE